MLGFAADHLHVQWFPAGSFVIEQGEPPNELFCILSGCVDIVVEGADGQLRKVDTAEPARSSARTARLPIAPATPT